MDWSKILGLGLGLTGPDCTGLYSTELDWTKQFTVLDWTTMVRVRTRAGKSFSVSSRYSSLMGLIDCGNELLVELGVCPSFSYIFLTLVIPAVSTL